MAEVVSLGWGVKESFRSYVESAGGAIEVGGGASRAEDGGFVFPASGEGGLTLGEGGKLEGAGEFHGEVRFEAHGGMLKVSFADPQLEVGDAGAVITVAELPARDRRVQLADLDLAAATTDADGALVIPAKLSRDGWKVLGDHYAPMTPLDAVRLQLR